MISQVAELRVTLTLTLNLTLALPLTFTLILTFTRRAGSDLCARADHGRDRARRRRLRPAGDYT